MRLVIAIVALLLGVAMLQPAPAIPTALAQVAPSASVAPSIAPSTAPSASAAPPGSTAPEAFVELFLVDPGDPAHEWDITATGGSPSVGHLTLQDMGDPGFYGAFDVELVGQSATVELATTLPPGWELVRVGCRDDSDPPTQIQPTVEQRSFALEVLAGRRYSCFPASDFFQGEPGADVLVEFFVNELGDPTMAWDIAVTGGVPSVDHLTLHHPVQGEFGGWFNIDVVGQSASLKMTTALPAGRALTMAGCSDDFDPPTMIRPVIEQGSVTFEVVTGRRHSCFVAQREVGGVPEPAGRPEPTPPPTDALAGARAGSSLEGWPIILAFMAAVIAASLLIAARVRVRD